MVEEPNWVRSPVRGWHQWRAANSRRRAWSSPRGGGEASNGPTTLKRSRAHCWWERISGLFSGIGDIGGVVFSFFASRVCDVHLLPPCWSRCTRHSLRESSPPSHNQFPPGGRGGEGRGELQQLQQPVAPFCDLELPTQRQGQRLLAQRRHESGAGLLPEGARDKQAEPPLPPPRQGAAVDLQV